jgi:transcriptional regulator with XRE-family HTH domain
MRSMNAKRFSEFVKELRGDKSRKDFVGEDINDQNYLYQVETGKRNPGLDFVIRLAHKLNINPVILVNQLDDDWEGEPGEIIYIPSGLTEKDKEVVRLVAEALAARRQALTPKESTDLVKQVETVDNLIDQEFQEAPVPRAKETIVKGESNNEVKITN